MNPILQFFTYKHLPEYLQEVSKPFCELAIWISENLEQNSETSTALRKLLEAKDAAVRAKLYKSDIVIHETKGGVRTGNTHVIKTTTNETN